jgi:hypothetical protein
MAATPLAAGGAIAIPASAAGLGTGAAAVTAGAMAGAGTAAGGLSAGSAASAATLIGAAMDANGQMNQAKQQEQLGKLNQAQQGLQGATALRQGAQEALDAIHRRRILQGAAEAQAGALGNYSGSAVDVVQDISNTGAGEVARINDNADLSFKSYQLAGQGALLSSQMAAKQTRGQAFSTLIGGGANTLYLRAQTTPKPFRKPTLGPVGKNPLFAYGY